MNLEANVPEETTKVLAQIAKRRGIQVEVLAVEILDDWADSVRNLAANLLEEA